MKKNPNVCPGCSKHCPMDAPRCRYGKKYFEKQKAAPCENPHPRGKWKRRLNREGWILRLFDVRRRMKKALRSGRITEAQLSAALSVQQQAQLDEILSALEECLRLREKSDSNFRENGI